MKTATVETSFQFTFPSMTIISKIEEQRWVNFKEKLNKMNED